MGDFCNALCNMFPLTLLLAHRLQPDLATAAKNAAGPASGSLNASDANHAWEQHMEVVCGTATGKLTTIDPASRIAGNSRTNAVVEIGCVKNSHLGDLNVHVHPRNEL